ncbi:MAG: DNA polymerase III subunit alpha [Candidatus Gastranaerophilales bacterium]|nr:DNA polymerase III subunit alpha [Candidatus Gastranaerophilales bacterium]
MQYVPLHLHTEYSLLDGATRIKELISFCQANNMPACALTDHGVMYGAIEFYKFAKENHIKPLVGCEIYMHTGELSEKDPKNNPMYHLILIAKNKTGYKNLVKLVSIANLDGFYYKPRINHELLKQHNEGLICLSACLGGELNKYILQDNYAKAKEQAKWYKDLFGEDYYIELQDHNLPEQKRANPQLIKIAKELDIELVITNDSHYNRPEDAKAHDVLLCLQTGKTYEDPNRMRFPNNEFYIKTADELRLAFSWLDDATFNTCIENTVKIADKCNLIMELGKTLIPDYEVPAGFTVESYLHKLVRDGLKKRYGEITTELDKRYKFELETIEKMGFAAYFLIVWDFINYSKRHNIPVGPGRGSAAGSLIAYALEITDLDPIEHNLLFERFLNPERVSMPDVDIDFCIEKRADAIDYVTRKYGEERVCQIITFGTLAARAALKGVARVLDIDYSTSNELAKMVISGPKMKLVDSLKDGMPLKKEYDEKPQVKELVDLAISIEGIKNNYGTHAAGVIISKDNLNEIVPLQRTKENIVVTTYSMSDVDSIGLLKMDFLGLRNLTIIDQTLKMIKSRTGENIDINKIPLDDQATYDLLSSGETDGVFQLESQGMKQLVKNLRPSAFEDIGALVALYRPGPLESGMIDSFVNRKHGREKVTYAHPLLEPILKDTYGTMVYQEQIMQIVQSLAGYSLGQADLLRRAMGKKKKSEMDKQRAIFIDGAVQNKVDRAVAEDLFNSMEKFAEYCFNRAHSAAYAFLAYQTAYLKAHYSIEYFSALLSSVSDNQEKTQAYIAECQKLGIKVLPPDVNSSNASFSPDKDNIRFGLASIKNVGMAFIEEIEKERKEKPFKSFYDFCSRVSGLNKRTLESLIKAGAFGELEKSRKQLVNNIDNVISSAQREIQRKESGQMGLFAAFGEDEEAGNYTLQGSDEEFTDTEIQMFEKELLGFYVTSHPLSSIQRHLPFLTTHKISQLSDLPDAVPVTVCGLLSSVRMLTTKKGKLFKAGVIEDLTGSVEFVMFSKQMELYGDYLEKEAKVIIAGKLQQRGDDEEGKTTSIVVDSVKMVENTNIIDLEFLHTMKFEDIAALKDDLIKYKGSDPLIITVKEDSPVKILANNGFWLNTSNDLINTINKKYDGMVKLSARSLD